MCNDLSFVKLYMKDDLSCGEDFNFNDPSVNNTEGANVSFSQDAAPVGCTETPVAMSKNVSILTLVVLDYGVFN